MNRRSFLGALFGTAGALVLPEPARVRAYSFLPGDRHERIMQAARDAVREHTERFIRMDAPIRLGDSLTVDPETGLVRAAPPSESTIGTAYLLTGQIPAGSNGVWLMTADGWVRAS